MKTFKFVEQYAQFATGGIDIDGNHVISFFGGTSPVIRFANYDRGFMDSVSTKIHSGVALTIKQATLLIKILLKYKSQFNALGVDVSPLETMPVWKYTPVQGVYERSLTLSGDNLVVKFPFNKEHINVIKEYGKLLDGDLNWHPEKKTWACVLSERNVSTMYVYAKERGFHIDDKISSMFNAILEVEKTPYKIELVMNGDTVEITNVPESLKDHLLNHVGEFTLENMHLLADCSSAYEFSVSDEIIQTLVDSYGKNVVEQFVLQRISCRPVDKSLEDFAKDIIKYAYTFNRFPVVVADNLAGTHSVYQYFIDHVPEEDRMEYVNKTQLDQLQGKKFILAKITTGLVLPRIALGVSGSSMLYGKRKSLLVDGAEKTIITSSNYMKVRGELTKEFQK